MFHNTLRDYPKYPRGRNRTTTSDNAACGKNTLRPVLQPLHFGFKFSDPLFQSWCRQLLLIDLIKTESYIHPVDKGR